MSTTMTADPRGLEIRRIGWRADGARRQTIVFLHEGLGSVRGWQDFPDQLCARCSLPGLVYSRTGYGQSAPLPGALTPDFLHRAAIDELDGLLRENGIEQAILVGHSDGASIAIIYAGQTHPMATSVVGLIAIAPHLFVESVCVDAIAALVSKVQQNPERLGQLQAQHRDIESLFKAWSSAWLSSEFHGLDLRAEAAAIVCPVLAIQGEDDQYGTLEQVRELSSLAPLGQLNVLPGCRHSPHLEARETLLTLCSDFINDQ